MKKVEVIVRRKRKEAMFMSTAVLLQKEQCEYLKGMDNFIAKLKKQSSEIAKVEATEALKRTGVLDKKGQTKKKIVSWE